MLILDPFQKRILYMFKFWKEMLPSISYTDDTSPLFQAGLIRLSGEGKWE